MDLFHHLNVIQCLAKQGTKIAFLPLIAIDVCEEIVMKPIIKLFVLIGALGAISAANAAPAIDWQPRKVLEHVDQGAVVSVTVELHANNDLTEVSFYPNSAIASFVSIEPSVPIDISAGEIIALSIDISVNREIPLQVVDGTLHVRSLGSKRTIAKPLPVSIVVTDPTEDWISEFNGDVGLTYKVPPFVARVDTGGATPDLAIGGGAALAVYQESPNSGASNDETPLPGCNLYVGVEDNSEGLSLSDWVDRLAPFPAAVPQVINVHGIDVVDLSGHDPISDGLARTFHYAGEMVVFVFSAASPTDVGDSSECSDALEDLIYSVEL